MKDDNDSEHMTGPKEFRIGFLVHDVSRVRRTLFDSEMKPRGMTRSRWWVLAQLSRSLSYKGVDGMLQTELAEIMDVGKVTVGGLIDHLEASGLVERRPDPKDRRAKRVIITEKGHEVLAEMAKVGRRLNLQVLDGIAPEDIKTAEEVLSRMRANILGILDPADL
ncbi:MAG: MarR family winged helix-turn-helix transcriptional regulator [Sagittula sp.]|uniref:MarR family winged helix-turn-helix transcriptional regulator n=1 Tax=Sagittula sp. TaxID=2038081 RepID=UPI00405851F2